MKLGVFGLNMKAAIRSDFTVRMVKHCEDLGYESWWTGEHAVLPSPRLTGQPLAPEDDVIDPLMHLAFVAAVSTRLLLGTGIIIVPQHHPLLLAKQVASLDAISGGRFLFGIGVGYLEPELSAMGVSMRDRAALTDDYLGAIRTMWYGEAPVAYEGTRITFSGIDAHPRPSRTIPIVVGGHASGAHRRSVEQGHGWYGFYLSPAEVAEQISGLRNAASRFERPPELGTLEINVTPNAELTPETVEAYAEAGVHRLIVYPEPVEDESAVVDFLGRTATLFD